MDSENILLLNYHWENLKTLKLRGKLKLERLKSVRFTVRAKLN